MEEVCRDMLQQGFHLTHIVPVTMTNSFGGGFTEGVWPYFATNYLSGRKQVLRQDT